MGWEEIVVTKNIYLYNWVSLLYSKNNTALLINYTSNKIFWKWKKFKKIKNKKEEILVFLAPHLADIEINAIPQALHGNKWERTGIISYQPKNFEA